MSKAQPTEPSYLSSMFGPNSAWTPDYDVATRMSELENFWAAGVTVALYDAMKHVKAHPNVTPPPWIFEAALKVVEERLSAGFKMRRKGLKKDERKIYQTEIAAYYRWREVWKNYLAEHNLEVACSNASGSLAGTEYKGGEETMRKAYQRVSNELSNPTKAFRYYSAMPDTREITGTSIVRKGANKVAFS